MTASAALSAPARRTDHEVGARWRISAQARTLAFALAAGFAAAAAILTVAPVTIRIADFVPVLALAGAMAGAALYCDWRGMDARLRDGAAIVLVGTLALLACALVSNLGLRLGFPLVDASLARIDAAAGIDVSVAVRAFAQSPLAIAILSQAYNLSPLAVVGLIGAALVRGRRERAWELVVTVTLAMQIVAIVSAMLPAVGAMQHLALLDLQGNGLPRGAGTYHLAAFAQARSGTGPFGIADIEGLVTFPSFHTVLALMLSQALFGTRLQWAGLAASITVIVSTIPIGGHYAVDLLAGALVWAGSAALARRLSTPSN